MSWIIYGATGYTGKLIAEEAVKQELSPILAGRSETKLQPLAEQLGLEYCAFNLDSLETVIKALQAAKAELVLHIAGPFIHTSDVMIRACLSVGAHYLDITGEIAVYQNAYTYHQQALDKQIVVMPGVGFDVVPSDCLLKYVADQVSEATHLEVAFHGDAVPLSRGTQKSGIEMIRKVGNLTRRNGELIKVPFASEKRTFRFMNGQALAVQNMWGDVVTAFRTTGVPNITTYFAYPQATERQIRFLYRIAPLFNIGSIRRWFHRQIEKLPPGPSPEQQQTAHIDIYAKASNARGESAEAWLETCEAYRFTALASLRAVELVLDGNYSGAMTPAGAFGADFVLEMAGTKRLDNLD